MKFTYNFAKMNGKVPMIEFLDSLSIKKRVVEGKMNIAEKYFKKQLSSEEFRHSFLEEKVRLDIEYQLEELKRDIQTHKSPEDLLRKIDLIEQFLMSV